MNEKSYRQEDNNTSENPLGLWKSISVSNIASIMITLFIVLVYYDIIPLGFGWSKEWMYIYMFGLFISHGLSIFFIILSIMNRKELKKQENRKYRIQEIVTFLFYPVLIAMSIIGF